MKKDNVIDLSTDFDYGFSFIENNVINESEENAKKLSLIYKEINSFLISLKSNPDKETIKWPNRKEVIEKLQDKLSKIYNG